MVIVGFTHQTYAPHITRAPDTRSFWSGGHAFDWMAPWTALGARLRLSHSTAMERASAHLVGGQPGDLTFDAAPAVRLPLHLDRLEATGKSQPEEDNHACSWPANCRHPDTGDPLDQCRPTDAQLPRRSAAGVRLAPEVPQTSSTLDAIAADDLGRVLSATVGGSSGDLVRRVTARSGGAPAPTTSLRIASTGGCRRGPSNGVIYFVQSDFTNHIYKYTLDGDSLLGWGRTERVSVSSRRSPALARTPWGCVYVSDYYQQRVQKFDANGTFISEWPTGAFPWTSPSATAGKVFLAMSPNRSKIHPSGVLVKT